MKEFKVGDRVRVYLSVLGLESGFAIRCATVEEPGEQCSPKGYPGVYVCLDEPVIVSCDHEGEQMSEFSRMWVHVKSVRRLKPKAPSREWWINPIYIPSKYAVTMRDAQMRVVVTTKEEPGFIPIREVLPRKAVPRG